MLSSSPSFKGTLTKSFSSYLPRRLRWRSDKRGCIRPITITIINHHCHINHCHQHPDLIRGVVFRLIKQASHDVDNHRYEIEKRHTVSTPLTSCNINLSQEICCDLTFCEQFIFKIFLFSDLEASSDLRNIWSNLQGSITG